MNYRDQKFWEEAQMHDYDDRRPKWSTDRYGDNDNGYGDDDGGEADEGSEANNEGVAPLYTVPDAGAGCISGCEQDFV